MVSSLGIRQPWSQCLKPTHRPARRFWWRGHKSQLTRWTSPKPKSFPISEEHSKCRQVSIETGYHYLYYTILYDVNMSCINIPCTPFVAFFHDFARRSHFCIDLSNSKHHYHVNRGWYGHERVYISMMSPFALHSQHSCRFFRFDWCYSCYGLFIHGNPNSLLVMVVWSLGCASDSSHIKRGI